MRVSLYYMLPRPRPYTKAFTLVIYLIPMAPKGRTSHHSHFTEGAFVVQLDGRGSHFTGHWTGVHDREIVRLGLEPKPSHKGVLAPPIH